MRRKNEFWIGLVILAIAAVVVVIAFPRTAHEKPTFNTLKDEQIYWESRIDAVGGAAAYQELVNFNEGRTYNAMHQSAHLFGGALFQREGDSSLSVCDAQFSFGCFHEFLGEAIATEGANSIEKLNQGCIEALPNTFLSCQHGIGHGILASIGYEEKDLLKALGECSTLARKDPIGGCYGGVFMEFNFQTMLLEEGHTRSVHGNDFKYPCDILKGEQLTACYYWHPQWLAAIWGKTPEGFSKIGDFCRTASTNMMKRACFEGVGVIAPESSRFQIAGALELCKASAANGQEELLCRSMAGNSFFSSNPALVALAPQMCEGYTGKELQYCDAYAHNQSNIADPQALP